MSRTFAVRVLLATAALLSFGVACGLVWAGSLSDTLVAVQTDFDAGNRQPGTEVNHKFSLVNQSLHPMTITSITPACSCNTEIKATRMELGWLDGTEIAVRWHTPRKAGPAEARIVVAYAGKAGPGTVALSMRCSVSEPESLRMGR